MTTTYQAWPEPQWYIQRLIGAKSVEEFHELREEYTLKGVLGKIACPMLFLVGAEDWAPLAVSQGTHCHKDNLHVMHAHTFNFLNEVLDYRPAAR